MNYSILFISLLLVGQSLGQFRPPPNRGGRRPPPGGGGGRPPPGGRRRPPPGGGGRRRPPPPPGAPGGPAGPSSSSSDLVRLARQKAERGECQTTRGTPPPPPRSRPGGRLGGRAGRGQCGVAAGECDKGLPSLYHEEIISVRGEQKRLVVTNGIPSHSYHNYTGTGRRQNPNEACRTPVYMVLPLNPTTGDYRESSLGPVGIASSGAFFYNHKDSSNRVAATTEAQTFDSCMGHADPQCRYHYHKAPVCIPSQCSVIGYLRDGVPVYGLCSVEGTSLRSCYRLRTGRSGGSVTDYYYQAGPDCQLDRANGFVFSDGRYGYIFSENYPFIMPGYKGTQLAQICSAAP